MKNRNKTFDNELILVGKVFVEQDDNGISIFEETERNVLCKELSIGQNASLLAKQAGVKWDKKFAIHAFEYEKEQYVLFNGKKYSVERVYGEDLNEVELTCKEV